MQITKGTEGLVLKELWLTWEFLVQKQTPNKVTFDHNLKFWIGNSTGRNIQPIIFKCISAMVTLVLQRASRLNWIKFHRVIVTSQHQSVNSVPRWNHHIFCLMLSASVYLSLVCECRHWTMYVPGSCTCWNSSSIDMLKFILHFLPWNSQRRNVHTLCIRGGTYFLFWYNLAEIPVQKIPGSTHCLSTGQQAHPLLAQV